MLSSKDNTDVFESPLQETCFHPGPFTKLDRFFQPYGVPLVYTILFLHPLHAVSPHVLRRTNVSQKVPGRSSSSVWRYVRQWDHQTWSPGRNYTPLYHIWNINRVVALDFCGYSQVVNWEGWSCLRGTSFHIWTVAFNKYQGQQPMHPGMACSEKLYCLFTLCFLLLRTPGNKLLIGAPLLPKHSTYTKCHVNCQYMPRIKPGPIQIGHF